MRQSLSPMGTRPHHRAHHRHGPIRHHRRRHPNIIPPRHPPKTRQTPRHDRRGHGTRRPPNRSRVTDRASINAPLQRHPPTIGPDIIQTALTEQRGLNSRQQWARILPTLTELEGLIANNHPTTSNRPRRNITPRAGINVRRESTPYGYTLHISGRKATGMLMSSVLENIELWAV